MKKITAFAMFFLAFSTCSVAGETPFRAAAKAYFAGEPAMAMQIYRDAVSAGATSQALLLNAAFVAREANDIDSASLFISSAAALYPDSADVIRMAGSIALARGDAGRAREYYLSISSAALNWRDLVFLGRATLSLGLFAEAHDCFDSASEMAPLSAEPDYFDAKTYMLEGRYKESEAAFRNALRKDSQFMEIRSLLAELSGMQGKNDEAWKQYQKLAYAEPKMEKYKAKTAELAPKLTKKPEELLPPHIIPRHTQVAAAKGVAGLPTIRVGLGTGAGGTQTRKEKVAFSCSAPFEIISSSGGVVIASGPAGETWMVARDSVAAEGAVVLNSSGEVVGRFVEAVSVALSTHSTGTIIIKSLMLGEGTSWGGISDKEVRGKIELRYKAETGTFSVINVLNLEEYAYGVLPSEVPSRYPPEALKAQAVLARTYAMGNMRRHAHDGYDLCDEQHCQAYSGVRAETKPTNAAVDSTRGLVLAYDGRPAGAVFFSNCGGFTQEASNAGWRSLPYWQVRSDYVKQSRPPSSPYGFYDITMDPPAAYCGPSLYSHPSEFRWVRVVPAEEIEAKIPRKKKVGRIRGLSIMRRAESGHVGSLAIVGDNGQFVLDKEHEIRKYLAVGMLRSTSFIWETFYKDGYPEYFVFYGGGWGHSIGFCQSGAAGRAAAKQKFRAILAHYYPGTSVVKLKDIGKTKKAATKKPSVSRPVKEKIIPPSEEAVSASQEAEVSTGTSR